jgi:GNAT superfamily N-acetyltransferase
VNETVVRTTYLEMTSPSDLRPPETQVDGITVSPVSIPCPELNRFLYEVVGRDWHWTYRLPWSPQRWKAYVARNELSTWLGIREGMTVGYFELEMQDGGSIEIKIFGLVPQYVGKGLGGMLLTKAIRTAWDAGASRVWVHTCTLDAPAALPNYLARGLRIYKEETETVRSPDIEE